MSASTGDRHNGKRIAQKKPDASATQRLPDSIDSFSERAVEVTSVLEQILHKVSPPKNLPTILPGMSAS
jgi:hypothetical protein